MSNATFSKRQTQSGVVKWTCRNCQLSSSSFRSRCPGCGKVGSLAERYVPVVDPGITGRSESDPNEPEELRMFPTGIEELDRCLGGGIVEDSVLCLGGPPGIGKSTLLGQTLANLDRNEVPTLYNSGEEKVAQIVSRLRRTGSNNIQVAETHTIMEIDAAVEAVDPAVMVVDSLNVIAPTGVDATRGSAAALKEVTRQIVEICQKRQVAAFVVSHIRKDGDLAGPKAIEHLVDGVFYFEGEDGALLRTLRSTKNRFGSTHELGFFEMGPNGLTTVENPSRLFTGQRRKDAAGCIVASTAPRPNGRAMLVEVQALVSVPRPGTGARKMSGADPHRVAMILAVLESRLGVNLRGSDIFINVTGGDLAKETALDLPIAMAVLSSVTGQPVEPDTVAFGELGLAGEVRMVQRSPVRLNEAASMQFTKALVPGALPEALAETYTTPISLLAADSIEDAVELVMPSAFQEEPERKRKKKRRSA